MMTYAEVARMVEKYTPSLLFMWFDPWNRWPYQKYAVTLASALIGQAKYFTRFDPENLAHFDPEVAIELMTASQTILSHGGITEVPR